MSAHTDFSVFGLDEVECWAAELLEDIILDARAAHTPEEVLQVLDSAAQVIEAYRSLWSYSELTALLVTVTNSQQSHAELNVCGVTPLSTRIVGGDDATPGSWPWQVSLQIKGIHICGGSLINKAWVMSSVHCFLELEHYTWHAFLGLQNLLGQNPNRVFRIVDQIILHPNYNNYSSDNDIALVRLSSPVEFTEYIRPVCLAERDSVFNSGTKSWVTGWGEVKEGEFLPFPETLQEVEVQVMGIRQCKCLTGDKLLTENMICAGFLEGGKDACQGDSGGPLMSKQESIWIQFGIVSFGYDLCKIRSH
ncbi:serine protease 27-like [Pholidichthys leucotaenia]